MTLILTVVLVLGGLTLYRAGRMTADKMELQNAADAMAFGVSTVEARDLNFAAYTNRAIIANEVAIGQAIGMASWAYHWKSIGDFLLEYNKFLSGPTLGISTAVLTPISTGFQVPGGIFVTIMRAYAKAMTAVNHNVNKIYGIAQQIYHLASIINTLGMLDAAVKDNAPDQAHMSGYGVLMLLSHLATYGGLPTSGIIDHLPSMVADQLKPFTKSYSPSAEAVPTADWQADTSGDTHAGGYGRLAAIIQNSGDPFTKGRVNPPDSDNPNLTGRGWTINFFDLLQQAGLMPAPVSASFSVGPVHGSASFGVFTNPMAGATGPGWLGFNVGGGVDFGIIGADLEFEIYIRMRMLREGGSELRLVVPLTGSNANKAAGNEFSWSSADTTNFDLGFAGRGAFDAFIRLPFIGKIDLISSEIILVAADDNLTVAFGFGGSGRGCSDPTTDDDPDNDDEEPQCEDVSDSADVVIYDGAFPTSAPLGAAFAHSGTDTGAVPNALTSTPEHMGTDASFGGATPGPISKEAYGGAAKHLIAWYYPPSLPASGIFFQPSVLPDHNVTKSYGGLPRYIDTTDSEPLFKSGGPFLLVGLTLDEEDFSDSLYSMHPGKDPKGRFALKENFADGSMSAVSKSEVYFKRPLDLDYFARGDGYVEHGSAFNPYWQAHLIETSHADRVIGLLLQHGELAQGISLDGNVEGLLSWLQDALGF